MSLLDEGKRMATKLADALERLARHTGVEPAVTAMSRELPLVRSCVALAGSNLLLNGRRLVAASAGIAVAFFLFVIQVAILDAARNKVTQIFDYFSYDLVVVPDTYQFLLSFDSIDRIALNIARSTGDISDTFGLNVAMLPWQDLQSQRQTYCFLIGMDDPGSFLRDPDIRALWPALKSSHDILMDADSQTYVGATSVGTEAKLADERVVVAGRFELGQFFYGEGSAIVKNADFARLAGRDSRSISMGLLRVKPGIDVRTAKIDLERALPTHTRVLTRSELLAQERGYFLSTKPIGVMLYISMLIACAVAASIIVQVIATDMANREGEFAVLKAMGAHPIYVFGLAFAQALLLVGLGLAPALFASILVLDIVDWRIHLGVGLNLHTLTWALATALGLAMLAGVFVSRRVERVDPADLY